MRSASAWNRSSMAAWAVATPNSPSATTQRRLLASASTAVTRALPAWSCDAIGLSPIGRNHAAVSCS
eukprot:7482281-Alexandrium_andersonii.AAC.1